MKYCTFSTILSLLTLEINHVLAAPPLLAARGSSNLVDFSKVPAPTVPIGTTGDFVSVDSSTKLFNIGGKPQNFVGR